MTKLRDIAKACNLDISTISRALQNDPRVKPQTKIAILEKAAELKYTPNLAARNLARGKTDSVVLLLPSIDDKLSLEISKITTKILMRKSKDLVLLMHHDDNKTYQRVLERLSHGYCDGVLIIPSVNENQNEVLAEYLPKNIPIVFIDRWLKNLKIPIVTSDNKLASETLTESLVKNGCHIIINGFSKKNEVSLERFNAVKFATKKLNVKEITLDKTQMISTKKESIGIIANTQHSLLRIARENLKLISENEIYFACFDEWHGEPFPAKKV